MSGSVLRRWGDSAPIFGPLPNVHLGVSVELEKYLFRVKILCEIPAAKRFVSFEPLLGDMGEINLDGLSLVIIGAESIGAHPGRECKLAWIESIVDQ